MRWAVGSLILSAACYAPRQARYPAAAVGEPAAGTYRFFARLDSELVSGRFIIAPDWARSSLESDSGLARGHCIFDRGTSNDVRLNFTCSDHGPVRDLYLSLLVNRHDPTRSSTYFAWREWNKGRECVPPREPDQLVGWTDPCRDDLGRGVLRVVPFIGTPSPPL